LQVRSSAGRALLGVLDLWPRGGRWRGEGRSGRSEPALGGPLLLSRRCGRCAAACRSSTRGARCDHGLHQRRQPPAGPRRVMPVTSGGRPKSAPRPHRPTPQAAPLTASPCLSGWRRSWSSTRGRWAEGRGASITMWRVGHMRLWHAGGCLVLHARLRRAASSLPRASAGVGNTCGCPCARGAISRSSSCPTGPPATIPCFDEPSCGVRPWSWPRRGGRTGCSDTCRWAGLRRGGPGSGHRGVGGRITSIAQRRRTDHPRVKGGRAMSVETRAVTFHAVARRPTSSCVPAALSGPAASPTPTHPFHPLQTHLCAIPRSHKNHAPTPGPPSPPPSPSHQATMIVADGTSCLEVSGSGEVLEPSDGVHGGGGGWGGGCRRFQGLAGRPAVRSMGPLAGWLVGGFEVRLAGWAAGWLGYGCA
jgi:hypothetical protein